MNDDDRIPDRLPEEEIHGSGAWRGEERTVYVLARSLSQARAWAGRAGRDPFSIFYVASADDLRGRRLSRGDVRVLEGFFDREDAGEIEAALRSAGVDLSRRSLVVR